MDFYEIAKQTIEYFSANNEDKKMESKYAVIMGMTCYIYRIYQEIVEKQMQKWDLSVLGEVVSVGFNLVGSADLYGDWGLNAPAYFAYDDVAVRFDKNETALPNLSTLQGEAGGGLNSQKVLHNSQLLILRDGKTYNMMGQEL